MKPIIMLFIPGLVTMPAYALQAAPGASGPFANVPGASSPFTNSIVGSRQFFRLMGN